MVSNKEVAVIELGLKDYQETWDFQENLFKQTVNIKIENRKNDISSKPTPNYLIFCEHPHVYTLGKSGKKENLLLNDHELNEVSASYYKVNRGGDITYHGPGQLVCYPILDLDNFFTDIHRYLRYLEEAVIKTLAEFNIPAGRIDGLTGVWIDFDDAQKARKICAMGVKSSRWVTMHGLALNVNTDLKYFSYIIPCGIDDKAVTSMKQELGRSLDMQQVKSILTQKLLSIFGMIKQVDTKEQLK